jgi:hypothetical protein
VKEEARKAKKGKGSTALTSNSAQRYHFKCGLLRRRISSAGVPPAGLQSPLRGFAQLHAWGQQCSTTPV